MERQSIYHAELLELPPGLDRAVLRVVGAYTVEYPISRQQLVGSVGSLGFSASERQVREMIKQLRRRGHLICSTPGINGGYYMARSMEEYQEFRETEFAAKISDMAETLRAMDATAREQFGPGYQGRLF